ncbi:hypothetical protein KSW81_006772 [Nannochloris sp. 'desiccata']|nr:hypothetical protein KSW81_006772 [Chlorella desiccata (nom. nud.)]
MVAIQTIDLTRSVGSPLRRPDKSDIIRAVPLAAGALGITSVLANRLFSGIEPALLAASSQSRADVVAIFLSAVLCLTGLQWLSLKPKAPKMVELEGELVNYFREEMPPAAVQDLEAAWSAISWATKAKFMVVFKDEKCVMHVGCMLPGHIAGTAVPGPICLEAQRKGTGNFLANLALFPGRAEFYTYLPRNSQSVIVQPCGERGVVVIGSGTQRAFTVLDQAWISAWNDKLEVALENSA